MHPFNFDALLRINSYDVDPDEVCRQLGMKSKWKWKIGEPRITPKGDLLKGNRESSYCTFVIERQENEILEDLLERTAKSLVKHKELFSRIRQGGGRIEFFIGWHTSGNSGSVLSYSLLKYLADLQIDLSLDVYGGE